MTYDNRDDLVRLLEDSNIEASNWDQWVSVLRDWFRQAEMPAVAVLAISQSKGPLIAVCASGVLLRTEETGLFKRKPPSFQYIPYSQLQTIAEDWAGYSKAPDPVIEGVGHDSESVFQLVWYNEEIGGPERDRVLNAMLRAWRGEFI